jgi:hypothetical protein
MNRVRDEAIVDWDIIMAGRMKSDDAIKIRKRLSSFDQQNLAVLYRLVPRIVDTTLHHLLWTLDHVKSVDVSVRTVAGSLPSLREISDGLPGELYGDHGWIRRFSIMLPEN